MLTPYVLLNEGSQILLFLENTERTFLDEILNKVLIKENTQTLLDRAKNGPLSQAGGWYLWVKRKRQREGCVRERKRTQDVGGRKGFLDALPLPYLILIWFKIEKSVLKAQVVLIKAL